MCVLDDLQMQIQHFTPGKNMGVECKNVGQPLDLKNLGQL